ncbi:MAG TPA: glycosyltransferase [Roseiflexaceae bacterium]|nr:glycosyltransferase [Roseiflexaceae bacterium]
MTSNTPLVSIIVTSYNYARYIGQTIRSVLDQTYPHWELIVSDDGSRDGSPEVVRSFDDPRITLIASPVNEGASAAYMKAYARCRGVYLCSLDSDDAMVPERLARQVAFLEARPEVDVLGTFISEIGSDGRPVEAGAHETWFNQAVDLNDPRQWIWQNRLCHSAVLMRKALHDRVGPFSDELVYTPDYELWVRCLVAGARFHVLPEQLTLYRFHGDNITWKDPARALLEYAFIFCRWLSPHLLERGLEPALVEAVIQLMEHSLFVQATADLRRGIVARLLDPAPECRPYRDFVADCARPDRSSSAAAVLLELQDRARRSQAWAQELAASKAWLEADRDRWRHEAEYSAALLRELQDWTAAIERAKGWLVEDRDRWQRETTAALEHARQLETLVHEQEASIQQLMAERDELLRRDWGRRLVRRIRTYRRALVASTRGRGAREDENNP